MTKREAWKVIAGRVKRNPNLFLCVQIDELRNRGVISQRVAEGMRADIERVRGKAQLRTGKDLYALWPSSHPERLRFAKMAARGHARDYVYPEELLTDENW